MRTVLLALIAGAALSSHPAMAQDLSGARLADSCASCHGVDGRSPGAIPALAGQSAEDLIAKLTAYRTEPAGAIMQRIARGYTDAEIAALAAYFSGLEAK